MSIIDEALQRSQVGGTPPIAAVRPSRPLRGRRTRRGWTAGLLVVLVIGLGALAAWKRQGQVPALTGELAAEAVPSADLSPATRRAQQRLASSGAPVVEVDGFQLHGIVGGGGEPLVLVNGQVLRVGDRIGDAIVESIAGNSASMRRDTGRVVTLHME